MKPNLGGEIRFVALCVAIVAGLLMLGALGAVVADGVSSRIHRAVEAVAFLLAMFGLGGFVFRQRLAKFGVSEAWIVRASVAAFVVGMVAFIWFSPAYARLN